MADSLLDGIVINEILADPNGAANFDTDGNGSASTLDEFVEIVNTSDSAIDISGFELWDAGQNNWFTFPSGTVLQPGAHAMVLAGIQAEGSLPDNDGPDKFFDAGRGVSVINNDGDNVVLYDPGTDEFIVAAFNGDTFDDPVADYSGFSATATQSGTGEDFGSDIDGFSIQRAPDGSDTFVNDDTPTPGVTNICFTGGTWFETSNGPTLIEDLQPGDRLRTADNGFQAIRWIWGRKWTAPELRETPALWPVRIKQGALGNGLPEQTLMVSRQHRILVASRIAQRMFDCAEVLVPAKDLLALDGVDLLSDCKSLSYFHILFDKHEIVFANGTPSESLHLGPQAINSISNEALEELCAVFKTDLAGLLEMASTPARQFAAGNRARRLAYRHARNTKPVAPLIQRHFDHVAECDRRI